MRALLIFVLFFPLCASAQINFQLGQAITVGNNSEVCDVTYEHYVGTYNSDFRKLGMETFLKVSSYNLTDSTKFSVKYTLGFSVKYFRYYSSSSHQTIANYFDEPYFDVGASNFFLRTVSCTNGADFIYRINPKLTLINTLGLKLAVMNKRQEERLWGTGARLHTYDLSHHETPITNPQISINLSPQLLINFSNFSLGLHLNQDLFMVNHAINKIKDSQPDFGKVQLSTFTSFGISIMPNFYLISEPDPVELDH